TEEVSSLEIFEILIIIKINSSSSQHPETSGESEMINQLKTTDFMPLAEFIYKMQYTPIGMSPFHATYRFYLQ
ncbi:hypothetical protein E2320_019511, partial [Naja naja]